MFFFPALKMTSLNSFAQAFQHSKYSALGSLLLIALLELYIDTQTAKIWSTFNISRLQNLKLVFFPCFY